MAADRELAGLEQLRDESVREGCDVRVVHVDVADAESVGAMIDLADAALAACRAW